MMENICEGRLCTGCSACSQICPQSAVTMIENKEGFLYPQINGSLCNDCGLCAGTCPINAVCKDQGDQKTTSNGDAVEQRFCTELETDSSARQCRQPDFQSDDRHKVYACFSMDEDIRSKSSSGGVFTQLALKVLAENGVVFGAGFDEAFKVQHKYIEDKDELDGLRRSKYVQSDTAGTFREAKIFLKEGRKVLYCGTPCQIAGLKSFLNREYDSLLTCDLACHGVPSPKVWQMFLDFLRDQYKSDIKSVSFRDKSTGWNNSSMKIDFENGSRYMERVKREMFFIGFGKSIFNRTSCYDCKFRIDRTKADITLADFWGIDRQSDKDYMDNKGISLIITHTEAGENAMSQISGDISMKQRMLDEAVKYNPRLVSSVPEPAGRRIFFEELGSGHSFDMLRRKYMDNFSLKYKAKILVKQLLGKA
jgi:coenzyme F420-reducing hydrogenase beta subunit